MVRGLLICTLVRANAVLLKSVTGTWNRGVLKMLKNSVRNSSVYRSAKRVYLANAVSKFVVPAPRKPVTILGALPNV